MSYHTIALATNRFAEKLKTQMKYKWCIYDNIDNSGVCFEYPSKYLLYHVREFQYFYHYGYILFSPVSVLDIPSESAGLDLQLKPKQVVAPRPLLCTLYYNCMCN